MIHCTCTCILTHYSLTLILDTHSNFKRGLSMYIPIFWIWHILTRAAWRVFSCSCFKFKFTAHAALIQNYSSVLLLWEHAYQGGTAQHRSWKVWYFLGAEQLSCTLWEYAYNYQKTGTWKVLIWSCCEYPNGKSENRDYSSSVIRPQNHNTLIGTAYCYYEYDNCSANHCSNLGKAMKTLP